MTLHACLEDSVQRHPDRVAVEEGGARVTYRELGQLSDRLRDWLKHAGVGPGDRVALYMRKSVDAVASIFGVLKSGAAYVPLDPSAPLARNAYILDDCQTKVAVVERRFAEGLRPKLQSPGSDPSWLELEHVGGGAGLASALDAASAPPVAPGAVPSSDDLAYILYTSGSTGRPKGVMLSHENAVSFVEWCSEVLGPQPEDRFSSHAPFHFDLSILDIYTPIRHGATLVLIPEEIGKDPLRLGELIAESRISVWYSVPSILRLLARHGKLDSRRYQDLRLVLFAGEVFPIAHLRDLKRLWSAPRYLNLYGPTETNVCTFYEAPAEIPEDRTDPLPIGKVCSHLEAMVVDEVGRPLAAGAEGELCFRGRSVLQGYWNLPDQTRQAFLDPGDGSRWYRTGDLVIEEPDGNFRFLGRRDRMVKKRGYRVELGEIETCLHQHPEVREAAVVALPHDEAGMVIRAHLGTEEGKTLSLIQLKRFCSEHLPLYMVPDSFCFHARLPRTSTDKIDYQSLKSLE
jgi:amino acid adenylation domain-containing protein